jgi:cytosine deaminase
VSDLPSLELRSFTGARLPRWSLPTDWPSVNGSAALAEVRWDDDTAGTARVTSICPASAVNADSTNALNLHGAPVLPGLVDAHTHIDKTFTLERVGPVEPGLLGAIEAMMRDRSGWTAQDIRVRADRALEWAWTAGVTCLRTHVDWWEPERTPLAWPVLKELAEEWSSRLAVERVSLIPLALFADRSQAMTLAQTVAASGPGARLGGFVHTSNWDPRALRNLFEAAQASGIDVDLHVDEELNAEAAGLAHTVRVLRDIEFAGRVVCGHVCALAAQDDAIALKTLDEVARAPITLISLPITNLLLQDARTGRTPRQRGITLLKEARARGIPLLIASDNVQDPFCAVGSYDPIEALSVGVLAGQLDEAFDVWSESVCRADWLGRKPLKSWQLTGSIADFVVFTSTQARGFPSRSQPRVVVRNGRIVNGEMPSSWTSHAAAANASARAGASQENSA